MNNDNKYKIRLASKNEGVDYIDNEGIYRFNTILNNKEWKLYIPGSFGENYEAYELTEKEEKIIVDRITEYLKEIKWLGLFKRQYSVKVIRESRN